VSTVAEVMRRDKLVTASPETTLREAARIMAREGVGSLLIVSQDMRLQGIFTERDLARALAGGAEPDKDTLGQYMTRDPVTAGPGETLIEAAHKMIEHGIRHLPIVDEAGRLIGVVSIRDILRRILSQQDFP